MSTGRSSLLLKGHQIRCRLRQRPRSELYVPSDRSGQNFTHLRDYLVQFWRNESREESRKRVEEALYVLCS